jgi:hypothetical protein
MTEASEQTFPHEPGAQDAFPESLYGRAMSFYHPVSELSREDVSRFFVLNEEEFSMLYDRPLGSIYRKENPLKDFALTLQRDRAQTRIAADLMREFEPTLVGVHLELTESLQPAYWRAAYPDVYSVGADARRRFGSTIDAAYREIDERVGELLAAMPEGGLVCVVGNRGFGHPADPGLEPEEAASLPPTISNRTALILYGHGIQRDRGLPRANLTDVTPTLLVAMDVPVGQFMDGRALAEAFTPEFLAAHPLRPSTRYRLPMDPTARYPEPAQAEAEPTPIQTPEASP